MARLAQLKLIRPAMLIECGRVLSGIDLCSSLPEGKDLLRCAKRIVLRRLRAYGNSVYSGSSQVTMSINV